MCDYCSCREQSLIGRLGGDHAQLLAWAVRIEAALVAADHDRARAGLEQLLAILDPHLDLEERALVPALSADDAFAVTVTRIADDHHRARVDRPAPDMSAPAWAAATRAYLADLRAHIHLEEYDVFPAATQLLSPAQWSAAEAAALSSSGMGGDGPSPWIARFASLVPLGRAGPRRGLRRGRHTRFFRARGATRSRR